MSDFSIIHVDILADANAITPSLLVVVRLKNNGNTFQTTSTFGELYFKDGTGTDHYIGRLVGLDSAGWSLSSQQDISLQFRCDLSYETIRQIEALRKGTKFNYKLILSLGGVIQSSNAVRTQRMEMAGLVEKSKWSEEILDALKYTKAEYIPLRFSELVTDPRLATEATHFKQAVKDYDRGEYDDVLEECRKAVNGLLAQKEPLKLPEKLGNLNYLRAMDAACHHFSLGAHSKSETKTKVARSDAELALLYTLGILRFATYALTD